MMATSCLVQHKVLPIFNISAANDYTQQQLKCNCRRNLVSDVFEEYSRPFTIKLVRYSDRELGGRVKKISIFV